MLGSLSLLSRHLTAALLASFILGNGCFATSIASEADDDEEDQRLELREALQTLWTGRPEQKRELAEETLSWSEYLRSADGEDEDVIHAVEWLRTIVRTEKDDWIVNRLLEYLIAVFNPALDSLYREALKSSSPNARWHAVEWFQSRPDPGVVPLFEELWRSEGRPWARKDLMEALAENGSHKFVKDFRDLAGGKDVSLALAGIEALRTLGNEEFVADLAKLALDGDRSIRPTAVQALANWPESEDALDAVLAASRDEDPTLQGESILALKEFPSEIAATRLLELAGEGLDAQVRHAAVGALEDVRPAGLAELLAEILKEPTCEGNALAQAAALRALHTLDDSSVLPALTTLRPRVGNALAGRLSSLMQFLSRDRAAPVPQAETTTISCFEGAGGSHFEHREQYFVLPPSGFLTIRCWEYPGVPGDPEDFPRLPAGSKVWINDHFEMGDESWVEVDGEDADECWVPMRFVQLVPEQEGAPPAEEMSPFRREFDLSIEELHGEAATALREAELLESIDPAEEVIGVALTLHPEDVEALPVLVAAYRDDGSLLDNEVAGLLNALHDALPGQPDLREFFRIYPGERRE